MINRNYIIPIFVSHKGCPNDCVFCNQRKITGISTEIDERYVKDRIEKYLLTIPNGNSIIEVAFYGGSFTGINIETQKELLKVVKIYKDKGKINKIRLSTRPDYINNNILEYLKEYGVDIIELGVQSLDNDVLINSRRGHTIEDVYKAVSKIKEYGFKLGLQMMIGLVGDTKEKSIKTAKKFINLGPDFVRIYPTIVVKDTILEKLYHLKLYKPLVLEEAIDICCDLLIMFNYSKIPVIRLGLQATDTISFNNDIIAGPFHPSFRQIVESRINRYILDEFFSSIELKEKIEIVVNNKEISNIVGHKSSNINYLNKKYSIKVKVIGSDLHKDKIIVRAIDEHIISKELFYKRYIDKNELFN